MARKLSSSAPYFYGEGVGVPEQIGYAAGFYREPGGLVWEPDGPDEAAANRGGRESSRVSSGPSSGPLSELRRGRDLDQDVAGSGAIEMRPAHIAVTLDLAGSMTCRGQFVVLAAHRGRVLE